MDHNVWDTFLYGKQTEKSKGIIQLAKDRYFYYTGEDYTNCREIDLIANVVARAGADWNKEDKREEVLNYFESELFQKHANLLTFEAKDLYSVVKRVWRDWS